MVPYIDIKKNCHRLCHSSKRYLTVCQITALDYVLVPKNWQYLPQIICGFKKFSSMLTNISAIDCESVYCASVPNDIQSGAEKYRL
jgi:hypothetical protein